MKTSWALRAAAFFQSFPSTPTDETDETPLSSVSSVHPQGVSEKRKLLILASNDPQPAPLAQPVPPSTTLATCANSSHNMHRGTCARPVEAGLLPAADVYLAECAASDEKHAVLAAQHRPYKLSVADADGAHAQPWTESQIRVYNARAGRSRGMGFSADDADDLAERLHLRDVTGDERRSCIECRHYERGRCAQARAALLTSPAIGRDLATLLQRCPAHDPVIQTT
jgi:hypothetical protein